MKVGLFVLVVIVIGPSTAFADDVLATEVRDAATAGQCEAMMTALGKLREIDPDAAHVLRMEPAVATCVETETARRAPIDSLVAEARADAQLGYCEAMARDLEKLEKLDAAAFHALREEPAVASCLDKQTRAVAVVEPTRPPAPPPSCPRVYAEPTLSLGRTRFGHTLHATRLSGGFESAPQGCAKPWNLRLGAVVETNTQATFSDPHDFALLFGGELEIDRFDNPWYYGVRAAVVTGNNTIASLGVRVHTSNVLTFGIDGSWTRSGPHDGPRPGGGNTAVGGDPAFGLSGSVSFRGKVPVVVLGVLVTLIVVGLAASGDS